MTEYTLGAIEARFADIIWQGEPILSSELAKRAEGELGWKKSTTYTVLRRLCDKGIFQNDRGTVCSLISKDEFYSRQSERFVDETFNGSLPAFVAAFTSRKKLSADEVSELKRLIEGYGDK